MKATLSFIAVNLLVIQSVSAQGLVTASNLREPSSGGMSVASDSWLAVAFTTGANAGGYSLDFVGLFMGSATGNPTDFSVHLYSFDGGSSHPGASLGALSGPDPAGGGLLAYANSGITLSPSTSYFVVLTAGTPVASGAYLWSLADTTTYLANDGWQITAGGQQSSDGVNWTSTGSLPFRFSVNATMVPEPTTWALFTCGLIFLYSLRKSKRCR